VRRRGRIGLAGVAIAFLRSPQGQRLVSEARQRVDTPDNRARVRQFIADRRGRGGRSSAPTVVTATDGRRQPGR
jgi:hypothetical protein